MYNKLSFCLCWRKDEIFACLSLHCYRHYNLHIGSPMLPWSSRKCLQFPWTGFRVPYFKIHVSYCCLNHHIKLLHDILSTAVKATTGICGFHKVLIQIVLKFHVKNLVLTKWANYFPSVFVIYNWPLLQVFISKIYTIQ